MKHLTATTLTLTALLAAVLLSNVHTARAQDTQTPAAGAMPDLTATTAPTNGVWLETLDLSQITQDFGAAHATRSVDNNPLSINGVAYAHGIGSHAMSEFNIDLKGAATRFLADVGVDDEKKTSRASVTFEVYVDGVRKAQTGVMKGGQPAQHLSVDLTGAKKLSLVITDGDDGIDSDHGDWGGALILMAPGATAKPVAANVAMEPTMPIAMDPDSPKPAIHGARIVGGTPGRPFLYRIAATGDAPLTFSASNLPDGLTLNGQTGVISGSLKTAGQYTTTLMVEGPKGKAQRNQRDDNHLNLARKWLYCVGNHSKADSRSYQEKIRKPTFLCEAYYSQEICRDRKR